METARSQSPLIGKRRNYESEDSLEPPRKSPIGTPMGSPVVEVHMSDVFTRRQSLQRSRAFEMDSCEQEYEVFSPARSPTNTNRRVKKAVHRQRSLSPIVNPNWTSGASDSASASPHHSERSASPHVSDSELADTFDINFTGGSTSSNPGSLPMSFTVHRGSQSPVRNSPMKPPLTTRNRLDDHRLKNRLRRRSSCKELTLHIMRRESVTVDQNKPLFRTIESLRRMSMQQSMAEEPPSATASPMDSPVVARRRLPVSPQPCITRSLSAEGYNAEDLKEQQWDAHTMMFDSVPDLTADDSHERVAALKKNRRGAVCYDLDHAAVLLGNLNLEIEEDEDG